MSLLKSENLNELATALVKFQKKMPAVERSKTVKVGNKFSFDYAPFDKIIEKAVPILSEFGLCVSQLVGEGGAITTMLMHESGQYIGDTVTISPVSNRPQDLGSAITYAKRYSYASILGIASEGDDDGNNANGNQDVTFGEKKNGKQEDNNPWLNEGTPEWEKVVKKIETGQVDTNTVYQHFKVSKKNRAELEAIELQSNRQPA